MYQRPEYICCRAASPITIDGRLDEASWQAAAPISLVLADSGAEPIQATTARMLWDDGYLYVAFHCEDTDIWGTTTERDQPIYKQEVAEVFVDDDCDDYSYAEFEVSPLNAVLDLFLFQRDGRRKTLWEWRSEGLSTAVVVDGDATRRGTADHSWTVEMAIPMSDFMTAPHLPPRPGDVWHVNLYRIDRGVEGDEFSAWSPPGVVDYHTPSRFGRLVFSAIEA